MYTGSDICIGQECHCLRLWQCWSTFPKKEIHKQILYSTAYKYKPKCFNNHSFSLATHCFLYISLSLLCTCSTRTENGKQAKCCSILSCFDFSFSCGESCKSLCVCVSVCVCMPFNSLTKARSIHQTACIQFYLSSFS